MVSDISGEGGRGEADETRDEQVKKESCEMDVAEAARRERQT